MTSIPLLATLLMGLVSPAYGTGKAFIGAAPMVNGICSSVSTNEPLRSSPTSDLCYLGSPSAVIGSGPYTWTCVGSGGGTTASCQTVSYQGGNGAYYVSPSGSDSNNGLSSTTPFRTLGKCQSMMRINSSKICYLMSGAFSLAASLVFSASDNGEEWIACPAGACGSPQVPVVDGGGEYGWMLDSTTSLRIQGIKFQNVGAYGIKCHWSSQIAIVENTIYNSVPKNENGGSIYAQGCKNSKIDLNVFNKSTWSAVSLGGGGGGNANNNTVISRNLAFGMMSSCSDCGAFYNYEGSYNGHGTAKGGGYSIGWIYNTADLSGMMNGTNQRAFYDDDNASYRVYYGNIAYGGAGSSGYGGMNAANGLLLHGSDWVLVQNNVFDCTYFTDCIWIQQSKSPSYAMRSNYFKSNIFYSRSLATNIWKTNLLAADDWFPYSDSNVYYAAASPHTFNLAIVDRPRAQTLVDLSPRNGVNPNFVNPSDGNYAFSDGGVSVRAVGFAPVPHCSVNANGIGVTCK